MRTSRLIFSSLILTVFLAMTAFAQADVPAKIALVDTESFYAQTGGITRIANGYKSLETEFKKDITDLETMAKRLQALQIEVQNLQKPGPVPVKPEAIQVKVEEGQKLQREYAFKQEDVKKRYESREGAIIGPILQDVGKSIGDFAKQKGFTLVMDSGRLFQAQILLYSQDTTDITKEFIQFYNARPAGSATTRPE
jgi:Skp family chaperone for outer membrane proteins